MVVDPAFLHACLVEKRIPDDFDLESLIIQPYTLDYLWDFLVFERENSDHLPKFEWTPERKEYFLDYLFDTQSLRECAHDVLLMKAVEGFGVSRDEKNHYRLEEDVNFILGLIYLQWRCVLNVLKTSDFHFFKQFLKESKYDCFTENNELNPQATLLKECSNSKHKWDFILACFHSNISDLNPPKDSEEYWRLCEWSVFLEESWASFPDEFTPKMRASIEHHVNEYIV
jgi:hypothetical protein